MKRNVSREAGSGSAGKKINWGQYTPFQQKVYKAILKIPKGQVWTYGQVAKKIGQPKAARAVGQALSKNNDAPDIPCHRVVAGNGDMRGYSAPGGIKRKLQLLKKEGYKPHEKK
jgi:O-6-methylguanine DNA methyltransferase